MHWKKFKGIYIKLLTVVFGVFFFFPPVGWEEDFDKLFFYKL